MYYDSGQINELAETLSVKDYLESNYEPARVDSNGTWFHSFLVRDTDASLLAYSDGRFYDFSQGVGGNLITLFIDELGMSFSDAADKIVKMCGGVSLSPAYRSASLNYFKKLAKKDDKSLRQGNRVKERVYKSLDWYYSTFTEQNPLEWVNEGMSLGQLKRYNVRANRQNIVIPVYDENDVFVTAKCRVRLPEDKRKKLGIKKWQYCSPLGTMTWFGGMHENLEAIKQKQSAIIFESTKSCIKTASYSSAPIYNTLSLESSSLNESQLRIAISLHCRSITFALDNDKSLDFLVKQPTVQMLKRFASVYAVIDKTGTLGEKDSIADMDEDDFYKVCKAGIVRLT